MGSIATVAPVSAVSSSPIIKEKLRPWAKQQITFDPEKHLNYTQDPKILTLEEIGLPEGTGLTNTAVTDPFSLFSEEAVRIMRGEIFTNEVWDNCHFSSPFAECQLRGHCPDYAPFMTAAWTHPKTLEIISKLAGIDLVPVFDYELGNINVSVNNKASGEKMMSADNAANDLPVTKWHYDSYPFVCVAMLSDTTNMVGGETAVKTPNGEVLKVRGPGQGSAVVLQGRYISHQALAAKGGSERITMITAFRPRDPFKADDSVLTSIRPISDLDEMYFQWTQYRIDIMLKRLGGMKDMLEKEHRHKKPTDVKRIKEFLAQQVEYLSITESEIHERTDYGSRVRPAPRD